MAEVKNWEESEQIKLTELRAYEPENVSNKTANRKIGSQKKKRNATKDLNLLIKKQKIDEVDEDDPPYYLSKPKTPPEVAKLDGSVAFEAGRDKYYSLKKLGKITAQKGEWLVVDGEDGVVFQASTITEVENWVDGQDHYFSPFTVCHMKRMRPHLACSVNSFLRPNGGGLCYVDARIADNGNSNGKAVQLLGDTGATECWIKKEDVNIRTVRRNDLDIQLADGSFASTKSFRKYVQMDGLKTRSRACLGESRILGVDVIKRYKVDIDYVARPNAQWN